MTFTVLRGEAVDTGYPQNSSLIGYIDTDYSTLVETFGEPSFPGDGYKTEAEWVVRFPTGVTATIYDYKQGRTYLGPAGQHVTEITCWHVGGLDSDALVEVEAALDI